MRERYANIVLCVGLLMLSTQFPVAADVVVWEEEASNEFVSDFSGTEDTHISSSEPTFNFGNGVTEDQVNEIGPGTKSLIRFDLSAFEGQFSQIKSIELQLSISLVSNDSGGTIDVFAISQANADWVEGTAPKDGGLQEGSSSWDAPRQGSSAWAGSPGLGTPGTDHSSDPLVSVSVSSTGTNKFKFEGSTSELTALVETWTSPTTNAGILLSTEDDATFRFRSSERFFSNFGQAPPTLRIDYVPASEPPDIADTQVRIAMEAPNLVLSFTTLENRIYTLQMNPVTPARNDPNWTAAGPPPLVGNGGEQSFTVPIPDANQMFYRLLIDE